MILYPLGDLQGGTQLLGGRHPTEITQPIPAADAPEEVVFLMSSMCLSMPSELRLYGYPELLAVAEAINGADFVPFNDAIFVKQPGLGCSVSWHQDGITHWDSPNWAPFIHGFYLQVQLYPTTVGNCLWVVPGTHKLGRMDIKARKAENGGSEQFPGAVPLLCEAGDDTIVNRQMLHGSFANSSPGLRVSLTFGFHRRKSVLGAKAALSVAGTMCDTMKSAFSNGQPLFRLRSTRDSRNIQMNCVLITSFSPAVKTNLVLMACRLNPLSRTTSRKVWRFSRLPVRRD